MTTLNKELISALVDGELAGSELQQALELLATDDEFRAQWQRYQYNRDILQGQVANARIDLVSRVSLALQDEPVHQVQAKKASIIPFPKQFWKQAAGLAMAASVGAIAMVSVISQPQQQVVPMAPIASTESEQAIERVQVAQANKPNRWTVGEPEVEQRLNDYLVDHHEYGGTSGVFSYARVVAYEAGQ
jgi:sigma-E factor negative regulatory protein RseA